MLYVPEVFSDYCSESMMVMERIYGIPISDVAALEQHWRQHEDFGRARRAGVLHPGVP